MNPPPDSQKAQRGGEGDIVKVQGGHIIRSTGRKDRHSKVYTAKGPRDRRVRLSAPTAIQFYDVQDRLGYDRPSKAVDWLIKNAKSAIDNLAELPPFEPNAAAVGSADLAAVGGGEQSESSGYETQLLAHNQAPPALVSESMAETMKSMGFHGYPHQDLCLSLQSFQNPGLIHGQSAPGNPNSDHTVFPMGFVPGSGGGEGSGSWLPGTNPSEMGRFSRLLAWTGGGGGVADGYGGERGTLQSNFPAPLSIRAWNDLPTGPRATDHHHQPPMAGIGVLGSAGFMGFCASDQIHVGGEEDVHGTVAQAHHHNRASSMPTGSSR